MPNELKKVEDGLKELEDMFREHVSYWDGIFSVIDGRTVADELIRDALDAEFERMERESKEKVLDDILDKTEGANS